MHDVSWSANDPLIDTYLAPMRGAFLLAVVLMAAPQTKAQHPVERGRLEILWGWNRSIYSNSDIRFTGNGYDFTLYNVAAVDRPESISADFINPVKLTIPQTNLRITWSFNEHYTAGFGFDHMKYVMVQDQSVPVKGDLPDGAAITNDVANDHRIILSDDLLTYEHTDGLNYIHLHAARIDHVVSVPALRMDVSAYEGATLGVLMPRTACRLPGKLLNDQYHVSGVGMGLKAGVRTTFFKHVVLTMEASGGRIMMPDVRTSNASSDRASQSFWFVEGTLMLGASIAIGERGTPAPIQP